MKKPTWGNRKSDTIKKKTRQGSSPRTKYGSAGPNGQSKDYKKKYRGQGR